VTDDELRRLVGGLPDAGGVLRQLPHVHPAHERHRDLQRDGVRARVQHELPPLPEQHVRRQHEHDGRQLHRGVHAVPRQPGVHRQRVLASRRLSRPASRQIGKSANRQIGSPVELTAAARFSGR